MSSISDAQRSALEALAPIVDPTTYLGGGVALALRLAHRQSRDRGEMVVLRERRN